MPEAAPGAAPAAGSDRLKSLTILPTAACNLACRYCYRRAGPRGRLAWEEIEPVLAWALDRAEPGFELVFSGGEPLLEFDLLARAVRMVREIRDGAIRIIVLTNGTLLDEERTAFLARHGVRVNLSLDGVEPAQDARGPGTWPALDRLLERLHRDHRDWFEDHLQVTMTLTPANLPHFADSVSYLTGRGVPDILVSPALTRVPGWDGDHRGDLDRQLRRVYEEALDLHAATGRVPFMSFRRTGEEELPPGPSAADCTGMRGADPVLDATGRLCTCLMFAPSGVDHADPRLRQIVEDLDLGRLGDPGFEERRAALPAGIRNLEVFTSAADLSSRYGNCRDCPAKGACRICPLALLSFGEERAPRRVPALLCAWNRLVVEYSRRFPVLEDPGPRRWEPGRIRRRMRFWQERRRKTPGAAAPGVARAD